MVQGAPGTKDARGSEQTGLGDGLRTLGALVPGEDQVEKPGMVHPVSQMRKQRLKVEARKGHFIF